MTSGGADRWADLRLINLGLNDADVSDFLSLVNTLGCNNLRRLTIIGCSNVDGSGLFPLRQSNALECLRFYDNKSISLRRSQRLTPGPSPLESLQITLHDIINGRNLLNYLQVPSEWRGYGRLGGELGNVLCCSTGWCCGRGWCCSRGPLQRLQWCHECGSGPFCERGTGIFFVYCEDGGWTYCTRCISQSDRVLARQCPHTRCSQWYCACGCDAGFCFDCKRDVCYSCGTFHAYDSSSCPHGDDCEYCHCLERCNSR